MAPNAQLNSVRNTGTASGGGLWLLLAVSLSAVGLVLWLVVRRGPTGVEETIAHTTVARPEDLALNVGQVIDARGSRRATARPGGRYHVTIEDQAREGATGVARIDGLVTFVPDTVPGEEVIIEVTQLGRRTADGVVLERVRVATAPPPAADTRDLPVRPGEEFDVEIAERDRRNPDMDGVARIEGLVVFVPATQPGDQVRIRITELQARSARAEVVVRY